MVGPLPRGLTFERVCGDALAAIARERLHDRQESITEVARVLGFSEVRVPPCVSALDREDAWTLGAAAM